MKEKTKTVHFTHPGQVKCLRLIARRYNREHGTRLPVAQAILRAMTEALDHPTKTDLGAV